MSAIGVLTIIYVAIWLGVYTPIFDNKAPQDTTKVEQQK
jgi:hypothetical protein